MCSIIISLSFSKVLSITLFKISFKVSDILKSLIPIQSNHYHLYLDDLIYMVLYYVLFHYVIDLFY